MKFFILLLSIPFFMNAQDLEKHKWENRIVVVSSPNFDNQLANKQLECLQKSLHKFEEYKLIVYHVTNRGYTIDFGEELLVSEKSDSAIANFNVSLIGLDGSEKFQATKVQPTSKFYALIDAMPMRKAEIRAKNE